MKPFVSAVIVAAGSSSRMGMSISKQLIPLLNKPLISFTIEVFENCEQIDEIIIVCREDIIKEISNIVDLNCYEKVKKIVIGGENRFESVKNGIKVTDKQSTHFAIHDGARPLVLNEDINRVISEAIKLNAATLGYPVVDTIKEVAQNGEILKTVDRNTLRAVATPQVFEKELYLKAMHCAEENGIQVTDDCALIESIGEKVYVTLSSPTNIKITTPSDILYAESILKAREHT
ncbi:MAG: 2-C-methyl-D-erythritol 4-phosphate cytidylyltransferase [Bacillota bacterium]|nr:2-C-methyl-D-erythritol 4-phosphate cytidylyltransferase [Bacillota bacterium]